MSNVINITPAAGRQPAIKPMTPAQMRQEIDRLEDLVGDLCVLRHRLAAAAAEIEASPHSSACSKLRGALGTVRSVAQRIEDLVDGAQS